MGIRKNAKNLTTTELANFLEAVLTLKNTIANPADPPAQQINVYDQFIAIHRAVWSVNAPGAGFPVDYGHGNAAFLPWHREFLLRLEQALDAVVPGVTIPYWDWTDHTATDTILFQDTFIGPNGGPGGVGGGDVLSGYFAFDAPGTGGNPTPLPGWWPAGLAGWRIRPSLDDGFGATLRRFIGPFGNLAVQADVVFTLGQPNYASFRSQLEGGPGMHNFGHTWTGGHMSQMSSPNDLLFFLHHCNVDRLWAMWQINGHQGPAFYPAAGELQGHNLNDPMWPWVGPLAGYSSNTLPVDIILPDFSVEPIRTPADVLDHRALGYAYDTEVILGITLDQSGSMTGPTPDPLTGMPPNISKWEAAKQGVAHLLQDCEAAFDAGEAYVTAGVETFHSVGGVNTYSQIFPGTPYGLIKNGTAYSEAAFSANVAPLSPGGGTPLAGALTDTNSQLVQPPFSGLPAGESRYLSIFTDGKETSPPWLASLANPAFPNTIIYAMGFGVGSGWDGVDYTTLNNLVLKGQAAPAGAMQVFQGDNAGAIDKFYSNTIAQAIGYTPTVDPHFELFPGEHVMVPFDANSADQSFMITAVGFDFTDENWDIHLNGPSGGHYHNATGHGDDHSVLITMRRHAGRTTIFLNRNGAPEEKWVGRWHVHATYMPQAEHKYMVMTPPWALLLPPGSPPIRGPLFARLGRPASQRQALRLIAPPAIRPRLYQQPGLSTTVVEDPATLAVNIFTKSTVRSGLVMDTQAPYAGADLDVVLALSDSAGGDFDQLKVTARLVAPLYSIGNTFTDLTTIPITARQQYLDPDLPDAPFDEARYLADYERAVPGALAIRDEEVNFIPLRNGLFQAQVGQNLRPGVYRVAAHVEGTLTRPGQAPERFSRLISTEVGLGILPDPVASQPTLHWLAPDRLVITVTPTDRLGNVASPANMTPPVVSLADVAVSSQHMNPYTGQHLMEVKLSGDDIQLSADGRQIVAGQATVETPDGQTLTLPIGEPLTVGLGLSSTNLPVAIPPIVGDRDSRKAYGAGTFEAMDIPLEQRETFATADEAEAAGYEVISGGPGEPPPQYRVRITLNRIRVLDDHDLFGQGEMSFTAHVRPSVNLAVAQTTRLPRHKPFYHVSDCAGENTLVLNEVVYDQVIGREELTVTIEAVEYDLLVFKTALASHRRQFTGDPLTWSGVYQPGDEAIDAEEMGDWEVTYTIQVTPMV